MNTRDLILKISKEEFIKNGFDNTSLRKIASKCHISATAIYRHFDNKEEIFDAVISPFISFFNEISTYVEAKDMDYLKDGNLSGMWDFEHKEGFQYILLFGKYNDLVKLIVKERRQWFKSFIVDYEYKVTINYINLMKEKGYKINDFNLISFKVLLDSYLESYLNLLDKNLKKEELLNICKEINLFYTLGFRNLLGF